MTETIVIPGENYEVVYADPPWRYDFGENTTDSIETHYPVLDLETIKSIQIDTAEDALLYLWVTSPMLEKSFEVINAWGFDYRSSLVWDKRSLGMGHWFRIDHEFLLVARKGNFPTPEQSQRVSSVLHRRKRGHSEKPNIVRTWISEWHPEAKKIELFARERFSGWEAWGNETPSTIQKVIE
jgi:N6-adenosine-specific RNA methylase IME4